jgi:non-specific serine/threonine protein kinase
MIGTTVSHYLILGKLGSGGVGVVYEAQDLRLPRRVAVKFLHDDLTHDPRALTRFKREATALSLVNHPNICTIHEVDEYQGRPFIAMERLEGCTLASRLAEGPLDARELLDIAVQIVQAILAAHTKGIVHRDVKPGNVFLTAHGVKVLDFGLAKPLDGPATSSEEATADGRPVGTASYMSPEQIRQDDLDPRSDLFSVGVVFFEMATRSAPFRGQSIAETINNVLEKDPPSLLELAPHQPEELQRIVNKLLARDPRHRYQSAQVLLGDLKALLARIDSQALDASVVPAKNRAMAGSPRASVVVMPARVFGTDADAFLADAVSNAISKHLLKAEGLETKRPPTTGDVERVAGDLDRIASVYRASAYVVSSINVGSGLLELSVQLVDTASRTLLWSDQFQAGREAYGLLMRKAAEGVRQALQPHEERVQTTSVPVATPEAELLLQRGLYHLSLFRNLGRPGDFERAAAALERAAELEPERPDAVVAMALLQNGRIRTGALTSEVVPECEKWTRRALDIDPRSSKAWAILGEIESLRRPENFREPLEYSLKAAAFGPRDAFAHTRLAVCFMMHSYELSLQAASEGARLDPLVLDAPICAAISLNQLNRADEALSVIDTVLEIEPDMPYGRIIKGMILADSGATKAALDVIAKVKRVAATHQLLRQWPKIFTDVATYKEAAKKQDEQVLDRLTSRLARLSRGEDPFPWWQITTQGITRLLAERSPDLALDLFAARALMGIIEPYDYLATHPDLDSLRSDKRFQNLLTTSRRNFEGISAIVRAAQSKGEAPEYIGESLEQLVHRFQLGVAAL